MLAVGTQVFRTTDDNQKVPCQVIQVAPGRKEGDHLVFGGRIASENGDVFREWLVVGTGAGTIAIGGGGGGTRPQK